jgi:transposase
VATVWELDPSRSCRPLDDDPARFEGVTILGVDEHVWHHVSTKPIEDGGRGPKELTGMVDLTRDEDGRVRARLLDLVPGRSGTVYKTGSTDRGEAFRATGRGRHLDPFHGYKNAIDDQLADARAVLDAFHVVKLATAGGRRGPAPGPAGDPRPPRPQERPAVRDPEHPARRPRTSPTGNRPGSPPPSPPTNATSRSRSPGCAPSRSAPPTTKTPRRRGRAIARSRRQLPHLPDPRDRPARQDPQDQWRTEFLGYFDTGGASNGGTEAINGLIELHRRIARGFRNRDNRLRMLLIGGLPLRMLLIGGGLTPMTPHSSTR